MKLSVSPGIPVVLAVFVCLSSPALLAALLLSAFCHELGHYLLLRLFGGQLDAISITPWGAEMHMAPGNRLSYAEELLATVAGPGTNLLLSVVLSYPGRYVPICYLLAGTQLLLGLFNLLPIAPLDGGSVLWLLAAWLTEPYTADRVAAIVGLAVAILLLTVTAWLCSRTGSGGFLLLMAIWMLLLSLRQKLRLT